jgi:alcohol dehydrogenase
MRAARVNPGATSLVIEEIRDPALRPGSVVVRLEAVFLSHFISKVVDGSGGYVRPNPPFTPGMDAIGAVEAVADGVRGLSIGERVYCDSYYEPHYPAAPGERIFIGNFALGPQSVGLLSEWPDGAFAEKMCLPAACVYPIRPAIDLPASILCRLGWLGTAYGALRKANVAPGATVAVIGATGLLGSSAVIAALGLGAGKVYAVGRRKTALDQVAAIDSRVEAAIDPESLPPLDLVLSSIDGDDCTMIEAILPRVKRRGGAVFIGAPKSPLHVPPAWLMRGDITLRGSLWFEPVDVEAMLRLIAAGMMNLSVLKAEEYQLANINDALGAAHGRENPLHHVAVLCR